MAVTMVSHICLLVELGPICNSMAAPLCLKSCEDRSLLKSYNGGIWKAITGLGPIVIHHDVVILKNSMLQPGFTHNQLNFVSHFIYLVLVKLTCLHVTLIVERGNISKFHHSEMLINSMGKEP